MARVELKKVKTLNIADSQPQAYPAAGLAKSTQNDRMPLATSNAFMHTSMSTSGFLFFLSRWPIDIGTKTQTLIENQI